MSGRIAADVAVNNAVTQFVGLPSADANGVINTSVPTAIRPAKPTRTARAGFSKNDCKPGGPASSNVVTTQQPTTGSPGPAAAQGTRGRCAQEWCRKDPDIRPNRHVDDSAPGTGPSAGARTGKSHCAASRLSRVTVLSGPTRPGCDGLSVEWSSPSVPVVVQNSRRLGCATRLASGKQS